MKKFLWIGGLITATAGIVLTSFLTWAHYNGAIGAVCGEGSGCQSVLSSSYGSFAGFPTAFYGLVFYLIILIAVALYPLMTDSGRSLLLNSLISITGTAFVISLVLTGYSVAAIGQLCSYCIASLILVTGLFAGVSFWTIRGSRTGEVSTGNSTVWQTVGIVSLLIALIGGGFGIHYAQASPEKAPDQSNSLAEIEARVAVVDSISIGSASAPIRVIEFYDMVCPHCQKFTLEVFPKIKKQFIDTGEVLWTFRSFPIERAHPHATQAHAALSMIPPSDFLSAKKEMMKNADRWVSSETNDPIPYLESVMKKYGVEWSGYPESMEKHLLDRRDDYMRMGIEQTPSFLVNGRLVKGGRPFQYWKQLFKKLKENNQQ